MPDKKTLMQTGITVALMAIASGITLHLARNDLRCYEVDDTLQTIASLLAEKQKLIESLKADEAVPSESAILSSYLDRIRKDGVPKHAEMKQKIDTLVNNDTTIVALLSEYAPHARRAEFRVAATQFTESASSLRDRWQSVFEIFMAGGNLPAANGTFPNTLMGELNQEREAD